MTFMVAQAAAALIAGGVVAVLVCWITKPYVGASTVAARSTKRRKVLHLIRG